MERVLQHSSSFGTRCSRIRNESRGNPGHRSRSCCEQSPPRITIAGGPVSAVCLALEKATIKKLEKHESVKGTAESGLNTVNDLVSKALEDRQVSNEDFHLILREMENYRGHKAGIKHKTRAALFELTADREREIRAEVEQVELERGKKEIMETLLSTAMSSDAPAGTKKCRIQFCLVQIKLKIIHGRTSMI